MPGKLRTAHGEGWAECEGRGRGKGSTGAEDPELARAIVPGVWGGRTWVRPSELGPDEDRGRNTCNSLGTAKLRYSGGQSHGPREQEGVGQEGGTKEAAFEVGPINSVSG